MPRKQGAEIELDLDRAISEGTQYLDRNQAKVQKAINRALKKLMTWIRREVARGIQRGANVSQRSIKGRFKTTLITDQGVAQLWVGLNPLPAHAVGSARQNRRGTRVRGNTFEGAFYKAVYGSEKKVYRRKFRGMGSTTKAKASGARSDGRFPLEVMKIDIAEIGEQTATRIRTRGEARFKKLLDQELNYALSHER